MARPTSILHVVSGLDPRIGGPPFAAANAAKAEARAGFSVHLAYSGCQNEYLPIVLAGLHAERVTTSGFSLIPVFAEQSERWGASSGLVTWLARHAKAFDVVIVHGPWGVGSVAGAALAHRSGSYVILIPHEGLTDFDVEGSRTRLRRTIKMLASKLLLRTVDLIIFSSELEQSDSSLARDTPSVVVSHPVIHVGINGGAGVPARPARADDTALCVGFLGRLHAKKNLEALLHAIVELPTLRLIICGDGDSTEQRRLMKLSEDLKLGDRVEWRGFVNGPKKTEFFAEIDVLAMPSHYESFGVAAVEALGAGVPVVISRRAGVAATIGRHSAGIVVDPNAHAVRTALATLIDNPVVLAELSAAATRAALAEYTVDAFGESLSSLLASRLPDRTER